MLSHTSVDFYVQVIICVVFCQTIFNTSKKFMPQSWNCFKFALVICCTCFHITNQIVSLSDSFPTKPSIYDWDSLRLYNLRSRRRYFYLKIGSQRKNCQWLVSWELKQFEHWNIKSIDVQMFFFWMARLYNYVFENKVETFVKLIFSYFIVDKLVRVQKQGLNRPISPGHPCKWLMRCQSPARLTYETVQPSWFDRFILQYNIVFAFIST